MEIVERQSLTVWLYTNKHNKSLKKYGQIQYISNKMKYCIMYVDARDTDKVVDSLEKLHYVRKVEISPAKEIDPSFQDAMTFAERLASASPMLDSEPDETTIDDIVQALKDEADHENSSG